MADERQRNVTQAGDVDPGAVSDGEVPGPRAAGQFAAGVFGGFSLVGGLTWILLNLHSPWPVTDIAVGLVLAAGGLVLLMPHRVHLPTRATWAAAVIAAAAGSVAGLAARSTELAGMYTYVERRGFPFGWLNRGGRADDPETARQLAAIDPWNVNVLPLIGDVVVWAYAGILIFVLVRHLRGRR